MISILLRRLSCLIGLPHDFPSGVMALSPCLSNFPEPVGIMAPVGQQPLRLWQTARQGCRTHVVAYLACRHEFDDHPPRAPADQTAPQVAWPLFFDRRLVAVRCALREVASIIAVFGTAATAASRAIVRAKTPVRGCMRTNGVCYSPQSVPRIAEGLRRAMLFWRIAQLQAIAVDEDHPARHPPVIDASFAFAGSPLGKKRLQPRHLRFCQPQEVAQTHDQWVLTLAIASGQREQPLDSSCRCCPAVEGLLFQRYGDREHRDR